MIRKTFGALLFGATAMTAMAVGDRRRRIDLAAVPAYHLTIHSHALPGLHDPFDDLDAG
jgi:hypothetical protein